jgi:hypothetical protein
MNRLVKNLKKFYNEETLGLSHDDALLWEIAQDLADIIENTNNWTPVLSVFSGDEDDDAEILRNNWTVINIDLAIDGLHQALLDTVDISGESSEEMLSLEMSLQEYLLNRF